MESSRVKNIVEYIEGYSKKEFSDLVEERLNKVLNQYLNDLEYNKTSLFSKLKYKSVVKELNK